MRIAFVSLLSLFLISTSLSGCINSDPEEEQKIVFPEFNAVADDGLNYDSETTSGPFIAIFSAEWCSNPCHSSMHNIWEFEEGLQVFIFSTDSTEDPQGITLSDWHDAADGYGIRNEMERAASTGTQLFDPYDPSSTPADSDLDTIPDVLDDDNDNDNWPDDIEIDRGSDPYDENSNPLNDW